MNPRNASTLAFLIASFSTSFCLAEGVPEATKETSRVEVEQCVAQHDSARQLRLAEQWPEARAATLSCADERCPLAIAADCRAWLDELARLMPTLIIVLEGEELAAGHSALHVELDGAPVELKDPPSPIDLWPGAHRLRLEAPGEPAVIVNFSLEKWEKNHIERVRFAAHRPAVPLVPTRIATRPVPAVTYWLSAGALAALATSTVFLVSGLNEHADAQEICAPNCDHSIRRSIDARLLTADIAAGAGLVLSGLALYTYLRRPVVFKESPPSGPTVNVTHQGVSLAWRGQF